MRRRSASVDSIAARSSASRCRCVRRSRRASETADGICSSVTSTSAPSSTGANRSHTRRPASATPV